MATSYYNSFKEKLKEIFMMNHAELDFGIYRIMNQKRADIEKFLDSDLLKQVKQILKENSGGLSDTDKARIAELERQLGSNIDALPGDVPAVQEYRQLQAKAAKGGDLAVLENEVFTHLTTFFGRYYDEGDFLSKRRYKDGAYAIPYNGEEVKLHWANADQYYIKTSEYFRNYTFLLPPEEGKESAPRKKVHFILKEATTEQNNNKAVANMERRFAIWQPQTSDDAVVELRNDDELYIYFTYDLMPKSTKQKDLCNAAIQVIKPLLPSDFKELTAEGKAPTKDNPQRTLLEKHLTDYTAKNSFDYFIHKDLGGFLRRELDFYIKNEVMHIDDLDMNHIQQELSKAKAIKGVGDKIIRMLASLEDFQKKLWLKKKFVVQCDYCITLDRVPETFYPEICANDAQRKEWVRLFAIDEIEGDLTNVGYSEPLTIDFLKQNPFLVLDTAFFSDAFKRKLLASVDNVDEQTNGLLINSENFQALELLQEKYRSKINAIYIDPPYNTGPSEIVYKNSYKDSTWLSLMQNRIQLSNNLMDDYCGMCIAIDDYEMVPLSQMVDETIEGYTRDMIIVNHHPQGTPKDNISRTHEYALVLTPTGEEIMRKEGSLKNEEYRALMRSGSASNNFRYGRPNSFYAYLVDMESKKIMGYEQPPTGNNYPLEDTPEGWKRIYPKSKDGTERVWRISSNSPKLTVDDLNKVVKVSESGTLYQIVNSKKEPINSNWVDSRYNAGTYGTSMISDMFGDSSVFAYPKSLYTVQDYLKTILSDDNRIVIDYFAGSGTTGHAVIDMSRVDQIDYKYILCEMGNYFHQATRPRIEKAVYSKEWSKAKPVSRDGISQCFKYIRLEQYEDTLNNLVIEQEEELFPEASDKNFKESYMLGYMMDTETRGSLFNLQWFVNPFAMTLKTAKDNELVETKVDMVETFNFLIGLNVETIHWHQDDAICVVEGKTHRRGEKTLVIWRDCTRIDNDQLNRFFERMDYSTQAHDFDVIYVNGDNTLPNLRRDDDHWKVVLIEEEFQKRMFEKA